MDDRTPRDVIQHYAAPLLAARPAVAAAYADAQPERQRAIEDAVVWQRYRVAGPTLRGRPTYDVAARLVLGERPQQIAPELTRREAAEWVLQDAHATPVAWLWARVRAAHPELPDGEVRWVEVVRWVEAVMGDPPRRDAALRSRRGRIGEDEVCGRVVDRLDELTPQDLRASPVETIEVAAQRIAESLWQGPDELVPHAAWHDRLPEGVTVLRKFSDLYAEGRECRHCVAAYARAVASRECVIVRVIADDTRSTAEVRAGRVVQHKGPANAEPSPACVSLLERCRWT